MKKIIYGEVGYCRGDGTCPGHDTIYEIRENHTAFIGMVFTDHKARAMRVVVNFKNRRTGNGYDKN